MFAGMDMFGGFSPLPTVKNLLTAGGKKSTIEGPDPVIFLVRSVLNTIISSKP